MKMNVDENVRLFSKKKGEKTVNLKILSLVT